VKKLGSEHGPELVTTVRANACHPWDFRAALRTLLRKERDPIPYTSQNVSDEVEGGHCLESYSTAPGMRQELGERPGQRALRGAAAPHLRTLSGVRG
jgi:hypothetical protein